MSYEKDLLNSYVTSASLSTALGGYISSNSLSAAIATDVLTVRGAVNASATASVGTLLVGGNARVGGARLYVANSGGNDFEMGPGSGSGNSAWFGIYGPASRSLAFYTNANLTSVMDGNNYLLVGYSTSNGAYRLQVNSQIFATSSTVATSDGRYKTNVKPLDGALHLVGKLNPVQFSWKPHPVHEFDTSTPTIGFIAQEVQDALQGTPYLSAIVKANACEVDGVSEEFLGIAEGNLIALLTKAIQELKAEVDILKARIA